MKVFFTIWILAVIVQEVIPGALIRHPRNASNRQSSVHTEYEAKYEQKGRHGNETFSTVKGKQEIVHDNCGENWNEFAEKCAALIKDLIASLANAVTSRPGDATNLQLHIKNSFSHFDNTHNCTCLNHTKKALSNLDLSSLFKNITIKSACPTSKSNEGNEELIKTNNHEENLQQMLADKTSTLNQGTVSNVPRVLMMPENSGVKPEDAENVGDGIRSNNLRQVIYPHNPKNSPNEPENISSQGSGNKYVTLHPPEVPHLETSTPAFGGQQHPNLVGVLQSPVTNSPMEFSGVTAYPPYFSRPLKNSLEQSAVQGNSDQMSQSDMRNGLFSSTSAPQLPQQMELGNSNIPPMMSNTGFPSGQMNGYQVPSDGSIGEGILGPNEQQPPLAESQSKMPEINQPAIAQNLPLPQGEKPGLADSGIAYPVPPTASEHNPISYPDSTSTITAPAQAPNMSPPYQPEFPPQLMNHPSSGSGFPNSNAQSEYNYPLTPTTISTPTIFPENLNKPFIKEKQSSANVFPNGEFQINPLVEQASTSSPNDQSNLFNANNFPQNLNPGQIVPNVFLQKSLSQTTGPMSPRESDGVLVEPNEKDRTKDFEEHPLIKEESNDHNKLEENCSDSQSATPPFTNPMIKIDPYQGGAPQRNDLNQDGNTMNLSPVDSGSSGSCSKSGDCGPTGLTTQPPVPVQPNSPFNAQNLVPNQEPLNYFGTKSFNPEVPPSKEDLLTPPASVLTGTNVPLDQIPKNEPPTSSVPVNPFIMNSGASVTPTETCETKDSTTQSPFMMPVNPNSQTNPLEGGHDPMSQNLEPSMGPNINAFQTSTSVPQPSVIASDIFGISNNQQSKPNVNYGPEVPPTGPFVGSADKNIETAQPALEFPGVTPFVPNAHTPADQQYSNPNLLNHSQGKPSEGFQFPETTEPTFQSPIMVSPNSGSPLMAGNQLNQQNMHQQPDLLNSVPANAPGTPPAAFKPLEEYPESTINPPPPMVSSMANPQGVSNLENLMPTTVPTPAFPVDTQNTYQTLPVHPTVPAYPNAAENDEMKPTTFQTTSAEPTKPQSSSNLSPPVITIPLTRPSTYTPRDSDETLDFRPSVSPSQSHFSRPQHSHDEDEEDDEEDCCSCESCTEEEITDPKEYRASACRDLEEARRELKAIFDKIKKKLKCGRKTFKAITTTR